MIASLEYYSNYLMYGNPGTGKTTFGCGATKPIALIDIDNKAKTQRNIKHLIDAGDVDVYPISTALLGGGDLDYILNPNATPVVKPEGYEVIINVIHKIVHTAQKEYATIFLDSGTRLIQHLVQLIPPVNGKTQMTQNLWGVFHTEMVNRLSRILAIPINFVISFHERYTQDEITKELKVHPSVPGQMGLEIASFFNEVYHTRVDNMGGELCYYCVTGTDGKHVARTSGPLKYKEKQNLDLIIRKLNGTYIEPPKKEDPVVNNSLFGKRIAQ